MSGDPTSKHEERMARALAGRNRDKDRGEGAPARRPTATRTKPVRMTVDMAPALHRRLKSWTTYASEQLDVADVPAAEVVRSLVDLLTNVQRSPEVRQLLVAAVLEELREQRQ